MPEKRSVLISIVIPIFNEEKNISLLYSLLKKVFLARPEYAWEVIFVNDGSRDRSWQKIQKLAEKDERIKGIFFSRNFGHQIALTAGYDLAKGKAVVSMDADLQDPPALILEMLTKWEKGFEIVYAKRRDRHENFLKKYLTLLYYKFFDMVADTKIPRNVGDFRLIDKKIRDEIVKCREKHRYLRGMVAWVGFRSTFVSHDRQNRVNGEAGYTWKKLFKLAADGFTGFSMFPLKLAAYAGIFVITSGSLMFLYVSYDFFFKLTYYPLFKWLVILVYIFIGVQFILMWLLGEYIGRIHDQQKERPLYIIKDTINCHE